MIEYLISQNPKAVGLRVESGQTPLYRAFQSLKCSTDVIKMLLSHHNASGSVLSTCLSALWKHYDEFPELEWPADLTLSHDAGKAAWFHNKCNGQLAHRPSGLQGHADSLGILWETTLLALYKVSSNKQ